MMVDIYKALGIQKIYENDELMAKLQASILDEVRYVTPGYSCDYYLRTYGHEIEFELCKDLNGNVIGIDPHASGSNIGPLVYERTIEEHATTHVYAVHDINAKRSFPVRVICPDVLATPQEGERITGQLVAFADDKVSLLQFQDKDEFSTVDSDNTVIFTGRITNIDEYKFEFEDIKVEYWDLNLETVIGAMTIIVRKDVIANPEVDSYISAEALLSFDVAVGQGESRSTGAFYIDVYEEAAFSSEYKYGKGFYPNLENAEKVLQGCLQKGDFTRLTRACAVEIEINSDEQKKISNAELSDYLSSEIGTTYKDQQILSIIECQDNSLLGSHVFSYTKSGEERYLCIKVNRYGYVSNIILLSSDKCKLDTDPEIHALAMLRQVMEFGGSRVFRTYLADKCIYRSEHADYMTIGAERILDHFSSVDEALDETNQYSYELVQAKEVLTKEDDLPAIYQVKWCLKEYQGGDLVAFIFIKLDEDNRISNILLSRNGNYLKEFEKEGSSEAIVGAEVESVKSILESFYGKEDTIQVMRENETPSEDNLAYVWKEADGYIKSFLRDANYDISDVVIEEDCIGYACTRKGVDYAIYMYAYGKQKTVQLDAEYCQRLNGYELSKDREILITYIKVESVKDDKGEETYRVGKYNDSSSAPEFWKLGKVNGKDIILFYPREEVFEMVPRLIAAYNQQNLDLLKALFTSDVCIDLPEGGRTLNDAVYSSLSYMWETKGKMKSAYIRFNDVVYSKVPYIEDYCYISFSLNSDTDRIARLEECSLDESYRDLIVTDECLEDVSANHYPDITKVDFLPKSDIARFSVRMEFSNGEIRRYNFAVDETREDEEQDSSIDTINRFVFTDKIFANGMVKEHIDLPDWMGYRNYPQRGQGIAFVNGYAISTAELYFNSYPIEKFDYSKMSNVSISQFDYDEDGYGVGHIWSMDPENPYYLFDRNTMTAKKIPDEYQETQMMIYPFCGGYSEGLIMVNPMGDIDLQYHHNRMGCAGRWGWINKDFEVVIPLQYVYALNFDNGKAIVCKGEWDKDDNDKYWCDNEQWGVIDIQGKEIVPCAYDELYEVEGSDSLFFVHEGGWESGHYYIYDSEKKSIILELDFDFDIGYMFNECFVADNGYLVFVDHQPGEGLDYIYVYDMDKKEYVAYKSEYSERTLNGESKVVVNKDGEDIIVF